MSWAWWALAAGLLAGSSAACAPTRTPASAPSVADVAASARRSIVVIETPRGLGTGFVVAPGVVATNLHVVAGSDRILTRRGAEDPFPVSAVVGLDAAHDLALLLVPGLEALAPPLELRADGEVNPGDSVIAIGTPQGLDLTVSTGIVSALRREQELTLLQITAPISPGSSGGPLFDAQGRVIGVTTLIVAQGQNLNFAVPAAYVTELLAHRTTPLALADFGNLRWEAPSGQAASSSADPPTSVPFPESVGGFTIGGSLASARSTCAGKVKELPNKLICSIPPVPLPFAKGEVTLFFLNNRLVSVRLNATSLDDARLALGNKYGAPSTSPSPAANLTWNVSGGQIALVEQSGGRVEVLYVAPVWNADANY